MSQKANEKEKQEKISDSIVSEDLQSAIELFYSTSDPVRVSRELRRIFLDYLLNEMNALPVDFDLYLIDLTNLFMLLDALEDNIKKKD